jgi:hypothetical protein
MTSADLSYRQRDEAPADRRSARRLESGGGYDQPSPRTLAVGIEDERARYPGTVNDSLIVRDRGPYYHQPRYIPPPVTWISWTKAGPWRPELNMRCATLRTMVGNSESRYPVIDSPTSGMHTMGPAGTARTLPRYVQTQQMVPERQFRLAPGQYSGQTYSQTTRIQGSGTGRR